MFTSGALRLQHAMIRQAALTMLVAAGCAPRYAYTFSRAEIVDDPDVHAEIIVDPAADSVALELTNKTDQVLQVAWAETSIVGKGGRATNLRPDVDLGWIRPGTTVAARLFPLALPRSGSAAAAYEGQRFDLSVPMIVRRESKQFHYALVAHVREL
jgi:hypothetical protein